MAMVELEPLLEEEEINATAYHYAGDLEGHGRFDVMADLTRHDAARLHLLISRHARFAGSRRAAQIIENWGAFLPKFRKVMPVEYRRRAPGGPGGKKGKKEEGGGGGGGGEQGWGGVGKIKGGVRSDTNTHTNREGQR